MTGTFTAVFSVCVQSMVLGTSETHSLEGRTRSAAIQFHLSSLPIATDQLLLNKHRPSCLYRDIPYYRCVAYLITVPLTSVRVFSKETLITLFCFRVLEETFPDNRSRDESLTSRWRGIRAVLMIVSAT